MAEATVAVGTRLGEVDAAPRRGAVLGAWDSAVTSYYLLAGAMTLLVTIGLVMVLSSSTVYSLSATDGASAYSVFLKQAQYAVLGVPIAWVASRLPVRLYKRAAWPAFLALLGVQALVPFIGKEVNGNRNWIVVGGQSFQPSELLKLALALWLAAVLARKRHLLAQWQHVVVPGVVGAVAAVGFVLLGHDLGTALIIMVLVAGAFFVGGIPLRWFAVAGAAGVAGAIALAAGSANRVGRITAFFSPDCDKAGACYQTYRGMLALGSGGLTGVGLGESREKWSYLPEAHNDFIFAVLGEELGLLGTLLVVGLFGVLAVAITRVVRRHTDPFVQVATAAIGAWVLGQAVINIAVVIGLLPVVGVPLPLVSAGGTALVTTMLALGVVLSFARQEPGAAEALSARPTVVRRSLAVLGRTRSRRG
ncbi:putative lipid II flippase FtsW [Actinotalea sp. AC32]|nr:putative lipid II flippase FtsW [Actinotalea sp. AC32]